MVVRQKLMQHCKAIYSNFLNHDLHKCNKKEASGYRKLIFMFNYGILYSQVMVSMIFSWRFFGERMEREKSLGVWLDTVGSTQAKAPGSVQKAASRPDPWQGREGREGGHKKWSGDCVRIIVGSDLRGIGWWAAKNPGQELAAITEEQNQSPSEHPQGSAHEPCRRESDHIRHSEGGAPHLL